MTNLSVFSFENQDVRFVGTPEKPEWVASDVCKVLDIANSRDALSRLEDYQKGVVSTDTPGGRQALSTVTESGLYALIFTSRKEVSKRFQRWVFEEVLPSIRKTGSYSVAEPKKAIQHYSERVMKLDTHLSDVPPDHWVIMQHCGHVLLKIEQMGYAVGAYDLIDSSIGKRWASYRRSIGLSDRIVKVAKYKGVNQARFPVKPNAYHFEELGIFAKWLNEIYVVEHLPKYLKNTYKGIVKS